MSQNQRGKNYAVNSQFISSSSFASIPVHDQKPINVETHSRNNNLYFSKEISDEQ